MSIYLQNRMNATIAVLNTKMHRLQMEMCMIELRAAEDIDFSLQTALIELADAANIALDRVQAVEKAMERIKEKEAKKDT